RRIRRALMEAPRLGCFNFHPAPLPEMRGVGGYNFAILENRDRYGVSVHWVSEEVDAGDLVWVRRFAIEPSQETAWWLERKA
ncbi:MAG: formyltransferase family protein, partial [Bryobacteraceae bacterium]